MKCKKCKCETKTGEGWLEFNGEQRHAEYRYCDNCYCVYTIDGELIVETLKNFRLTSDRNSV